MAFLLFGLFWMHQDHASLWWMIPFAVFQILESLPDHTYDERRDWLLGQILDAVKGGRNVR